MYVFLDIDGVLNTEKSWSVPYSLDEKCIYNFCMFINALRNPKVVLTSTWKVGFEKNGQNLPQIQKLVDKFNKYNVNIYDKTKSAPDNDRSREIEYFLSRNIKDEYIIIDDDESLYSKKDRLYIVNSKTGFSVKDIKKAKKFT